MSGSFLLNCGRTYATYLANYHFFGHYWLFCCNKRQLILFWWKTPRTRLNFWSASFFTDVDTYMIWQDNISRKHCTSTQWVSYYRINPWGQWQIIIVLSIQCGDFWLTHVQLWSIRGDTRRKPCVSALFIYVAVGLLGSWAPFTDTWNMKASSLWIAFVTFSVLTKG